MDILNKKKLRERVKIMVGGGAISKEFAISIGADGYSGTAPGAVKLARKLLHV
jgi:methanogenic corrinoid protein MtbC1